MKLKMKLITKTAIEYQGGAKSYTLDFVTKQTNGKVPQAQLQMTVFGYNEQEQFDTGKVYEITIEDEKIIETLPIIEKVN